MKVVILGKGSMLSNLIRGVMLANCEIAGVFRYERLKFHPFVLKLYDFFKSSPEYTLIKKHGFKDLPFTSANSEEFKKFLIKENVDLVIVGTWCEKLQKEIIDVPVIGTVNVHPSLLPKYRGPNPYLQTIWHGEKKSGLTFHLMTEKFDRGPILAQAEVEILDGETGKELRNKTVFQARLLCSELIAKLGEGLVIPVPQDEEKASYFKNVAPADMTLDFSKESSIELLRHIRAFYPWLRTYFQYGNCFFVVNPYNAEIVDGEGQAGQIIAKDINSLTVATLDGKALKMDNLKLYKFPMLTNFVIDRIGI